VATAAGVMTPRPIPSDSCHRRMHPSPADTMRREVHEEACARVIKAGFLDPRAMFASRARGGIGVGPVSLARNITTVNVGRKLTPSQRAGSSALPVSIRASSTTAQPIGAELRDGTLRPVHNEALRFVATAEPDMNSIYRRMFPEAEIPATKSSRRRS
jgi:hypothetical protein